MKRRILSLALCLLLLALLTIGVNADMGPKPSVVIRFLNMGDELCYGTLLSKEEFSGPALAWDGSAARYEEMDEIEKAFADYPEPDGLYFLYWYWQCNETKELAWTYHAPETFRIVLYYPETGRYLASGVYERYAYQSYYTVDLAQAAEGEPLVAKCDSLLMQVATFSLRLGLTLAIELGLALLFGFRRKKQLLTIIFANLVTQAFLNVGLQLTLNQHGSLPAAFVYALMEITVFIAEAVVYCIALRDIKRGKAVGYALLANALSFAAGWLLL